MYNFTGSWLSGTADLFYNIGSKKSFLYGLLTTIFAIFLWYSAKLFPYSSIINQSSSFAEIIGRLLSICSIIIAIFSLPILFYGILGSIAKKSPKFFYLATLIGFTYFLYKMGIIAYDIYIKLGTLPIIVVVPFFIFIGIDILILRKLISLE